MKKWIILIVLLIVAAVLYYMEMKWQTVTMLIAAFAAPFKFFFGESEEDIKKEHAAIRKREQKYQQDLGQKVVHRQERIYELEQEIINLDEQLSDIERKKRKISKEVDNMSLQELQLAGRKYFGE